MFHVNMIQIIMIWGNYLLKIVQEIIKVVREEEKNNFYLKYVILNDGEIFNRC